MKTRGRPNGETWPRPGPLLNGHPANTQTVEEQSYASTLSAKEMLHIADCKHHFGAMPLRSWERTAWSQRGVRKHSYSLQARCAAVLICRHRCGRPFVRTDTRDQQWYCGDHDLLQPKRQSKLLELPGELRNEIYKHAFPPFLGLLPRVKLEGSSVGLLAVNKQVHEEVISLMYGTKPLRLRYNEDDLSIDEYSFDWGGQYDHRHGLGWRWNVSALLRLLGRNVFQYVKDIEISVDIHDLEDAERSILLDFVDALCTKRGTQPRCLTMKIFTGGVLTGQIEEVEFSRFLQAFREVPEFKDIRFELEDADWYKEKNEEQLLQRAYEIKDSLLLGRKRKFEQFQE